MTLRIRNLFVLAFLISCSIPLIVFWFWPHSSVLDHQKDEVHERHLLIAKNIGAELELYYRDLVVAFTTLAPAIADGEGDAQKPIFENLHFRHVCVANAESGKVLRSFLDESYACPEQIPEERLSMFRDMARTADVKVSDVFVVEGELPRMYVVCETDGKLVVGAIHTTFFKEVQQRISFGRKGHAAIVDRTGRAIAHPRADWVESAKDMTMLPPVQGILAGETGVATFYTPALDADMIAGFTALKNSGWGVMVPQPIAELEEAAAAITQDAMIVILAGLVLSSVVALAVSACVSRKIVRIQAAVRQVTEGGSGEALHIDWCPMNIIELSALEQFITKTAEELRLIELAEANWSREVYLANEQLKAENEERENAKVALELSERHFRSLFENLPISTRLEDFSGVKRAIDALGIDDPEEFADYLLEHPEFVSSTGNEIGIIDVNKSSMRIHGYSDKDDMIEDLTKNFSPGAIKTLTKLFKAVHRGDTFVQTSSTIRNTEGDEHTVFAQWLVVSGCEQNYERVIITSVDISDEDRESADDQKKTPILKVAGG